MPGGPNYDRAAFLEDAEWLADTGATYQQASRRLGLTPAALEKRLRRHGRPDLLDRFGGYRAVNLARSA